MGKLRIHAGRTFQKKIILLCSLHGNHKENWYKTEQGIDRVIGELARCGNQFVGDIKEYLL